MRVAIMSAGSLRILANAGVLIGITLFPLLVSRSTTVIVMELGSPHLGACS
jgi:hypothetical protein